MTDEELVDEMVKRILAEDERLRTKVVNSLMGECVKLSKINKIELDRKYLREQIDLRVPRNFEER